MNETQVEQRLIKAAIEVYIVEACPLEDMYTYMIAQDEFNAAVQAYIKHRGVPEGVTTIRPKAELSLIK